MNLVLLEPADFLNGDHVRLHGRRARHVKEIHRATIGRELRVGVINGKIGFGRVLQIDENALELTVHLESDPLPPLPPPDSRLAPSQGPEPHYRRSRLNGNQADRSDQRLAS